MGIFQYESIGLIVIGPYSYSRPLYIRGGRINTKALFYRDGIRRGGEA
jgi:hypothetical protein